MNSNSAATRYAAVVQAQVDRSFAPKSANELKDEELLARLRVLMSEPTQLSEQKAVLGLSEKPKLSVVGAFERFWGHIEDEWESLSHDQKRVKYGDYIRAVRNFEKAVGHVALYELVRRNALAFRTWWVKRLKSEALKPHSGNKDFHTLRRMVSMIFDVDGLEASNPFSKV